jgi:hypothetical protein
MSVTQWPAYVLHRKGGIPGKLRKKISRDARKQNLSVADTIRRILCAHYGLNCPPRGLGYDRDRDEGNPMVLVRMQPELFSMLKLDAKESERSLREIIIETLEDHYKEEK